MPGCIAGDSREGYVRRPCRLQNKLSSFSGTTKTASHASRGSNTLRGAAKIAIRMATARAVGREPGNYDVRLAAEDFEWAAELVRIAGDILVKEAPSEMEADLTRGEMVKKIITTPQKHGGETTGRVISRTLPNVSNDARRGRRPENVGRPRNDLDRVRRFCSFWTWRRFTMSHQKCPRIS